MQLYKHDSTLKLYNAQMGVIPGVINFDEREIKILNRKTQLLYVY